MEHSTQTHLLTLGALLLLGYGAHAAGKLTHIPRVTLLLLFGLFSGPYFLDVIPHGIEAWFPLVAHMALAIVGFLLGESFAGRDLRESSQMVLWVSVGESLTAVVAVFVVMLAFGVDLPIAMLLGGIAAASAPAATLDVIHESGARGTLTTTLKRVVAIDDAWGVMAFSLLLVVAEGFFREGELVGDLLQGVWEVVGAALLGLAVGVPMAWLTGRVREGEPTLMEAFGFVLLCAGLAEALQVSYLLACMVLGATVANRARHHTRPFREIEGVADPFLIIFFLLAGYNFNLEVFIQLGWIALLYVLARSVGKVLGAALGAKVGRASPTIRWRLGWCLLPQAGVALGLALLVYERLPEVGQHVLPIVIATTILFELFGPLFTRWQLARAGETHPDGG